MTDAHASQGQVVVRRAYAYRRAVARTERIGVSLSRAEQAVLHGLGGVRRIAHYRTWQKRYRDATYLEYRARDRLFAALDTEPK